MIVMMKTARFACIIVPDRAIPYNVGSGTSHKGTWGPTSASMDRDGRPNVPRHLDSHKRMQGYMRMGRHSVNRFPHPRRVVSTTSRAFGRIGTWTRTVIASIAAIAMMASMVLVGGTWLL